MMHVGDIMSTVEGVQYHGGKSLLLSEYPKVLNTPHGTHDIPPHGACSKFWGVVKVGGQGWR